MTGKICPLIVYLWLVNATACKSTVAQQIPLAAPASKTHVSVDVRGRSISTYVLYEAMAKLQDMRVGETLDLATDANAAIDNDIAAWSRMTGHEVTHLERTESYYRYAIAKRTEPLKADGTLRQSLAVVISDDGLEELLSPLGFALGAALSGMDVSLYFQGPGVRALERDFEATLKGFSAVFSGFARRGLAEIGHLPAARKIEQLRELGARLYACQPSMDHFGVDAADLAYPDVILAEYVTFVEVMRGATVQIYP